MVLRSNKSSSYSHVSPAALRAYLRSNGYLYREQWGRFLERFSRKFRGREDNVLVPTDQSLSDYDRRLVEAIETIAKHLNISAELVFRNVSNSNYEIIRIRVNEDSEEATIPYDTTIDLLKGGFALIDASATLAVNHDPVSIIRGRRPDVVRRYLDDVRVGQTEVGSFILTLLMPVSVNTKGLNLPVAIRDGFGARVSETLSGSLAGIAEAVHSARIPSNRMLISSGVTANFCGGLAKMIEAAGDISIGVAQLGASSSKQTAVKFLSNDAEKLRGIEERLTPHENAEPFTATGTVTEFKEPRGKTSGSIVIVCAVNGEMRQVRTRFERADRAEVVRAIEKKADVFLEVDGDLVSKSGHFQLERPTGFRVVRRGALA